MPKPYSITVETSKRLNYHLRRIANSLLDPSMAQDLAYVGGESLRAHMIDNYLTGQRLRRRTGKLASSFGTAILVSDQQTAVMGTKTVYARVHEYGIDRKVWVNRFYRRRGVRRRAKESYRSYRKRKVAAEKDDPTIYVQGHWRQMHQTEKRYVRDTLEYGADEAVRNVENEFLRRVRGLA